ncbi:hypothetical protein SUGI_0300960 [Cryptomeria japonica]|nr:hypothetical protein SUGI_0300960 [Cryptomeria japonica]
MECRALFWIACLFAYALPWITGVEVLTQEAQILLEMKKSLKDLHNALNDWRDSLDAPCNWNGICCDNTTGMVTEITIENKFINGPLYFNICKLQNLKKLQLGNNTLYGTLPADIMNCTKLQSSNLTKNSFSGTLSDFSPLKSLQILDVTNSNFTDEFPAAVGNLAELTSLNLAGNPFSPGKIPQQLMNLKKLEELYLADYNLNMLRRNLSEEFGNLENIVSFELNMNQVFGQIPETFGDFPYLEGISSYMNKSTGQLPQKLGSLSNFNLIDVSENQFTGPLPKDMCKQLTCNTFLFFIIFLQENCPILYL